MGNIDRSLPAHELKIVREDSSSPAPPFQKVLTWGPNISYQGPSQNPQCFHDTGGETKDPRTAVGYQSAVVLFESSRSYRPYSR
jgi:hypothetical protein